MEKSIKEVIRKLIFANGGDPNNKEDVVDVLYECVVKKVSCNLQNLCSCEKDLMEEVKRTNPKIYNILLILQHKLKNETFFKRK